MRLVLDTNILVSALIAAGGPPDLLYRAWRNGLFELVTSDRQLEEFRRVTRYPRVRRYVLPAEAGAMLNQVRQLAFRPSDIAELVLCRDPNDNCLLALAVAGGADYLVTGNKRDLLAVKRIQGTRIVTARQMVELLDR